jgi:fumarate hydratase class II
MVKTRKETDAIGAVQVDNTRYWGAQTQRSLQNFDIGRDFARMPTPIIKAMATLKKACAKYNSAAGKIEQPVGDAIVKAADEVIAGDLMDHFPLVQP